MDVRRNFASNKLFMSVGNSSSVHLPIRDSPIVSKSEEFPSTYSDDQIFAGTNVDMLQNVDIDNAGIEMVEEDTIGRVVQGDDGEYYIVVEDGSDELQQINNAQTIANDDRVNTVILANNQPYIVSSEGNHNDNSGRCTQQSHAAMAETEGGGYEMVQIIDELEHVGATTTAQDLLTTPDSGPHGFKLRRNRVYGMCRCPECGQSFVNTARLERHLAVHQVFGSYVCPMCGKSYKYEYNLFYHWRRTCRELFELLSAEERKTMDVNSLKTFVDSVSLKKADVAPTQLGINRKMLYDSSQLNRIEFGNAGRGNTCNLCGIVILASHIARHKAVHRGEAGVDERSVSGGFFCDLCGLMFRQHFNLLKHWRTGCPEIQACLPDNQEISMDDNDLKQMVSILMKRCNDGSRLYNNSDVLKMTLSSREKFTGDSHCSDLNTYLTKSTNDRKLSGSTKQDNNIDRGDNRITVQQSDDFYNLADNRWNDEQDFYLSTDFINSDEAVITEAEDETMGPVNSSESNNRPKWSMSGPVQCSECFRTFATSRRLERHLAGFHASFGSHHCILCGSRFKYDYNLLYHYRRSCPYTKVYIDYDIREQVDASNLRKMVRALSQKELRLYHPNSLRSSLHDPCETFGSRRQLLRYPTPLSKPPPHLLLPRPGLSDGQSCPVCAIIFYGSTAVERHIKAAHPLEWEDYNNRKKDINIDEKKSKVIKSSEIDEGRSPIESDERESPPTLVAEKPIDQPAPPCPVIRKAHQIDIDEHGSRRLIDENGDVIEVADGEEIRVQVDDLNGVEQLIADGRLQVQLGNQINQIIIVQNNDLDEYNSRMDNTHEMHREFIGSDTFDDGAESSAGPQQIRMGNQVIVNRFISKDGKQYGDEGLEVATILSKMKREESVRADSDTFARSPSRLQLLSNQEHVIEGKEAAQTAEYGNAFERREVHLRNLRQKRFVKNDDFGAMHHVLMQQHRQRKE